VPCHGSNILCLSIKRRQHTFTLANYQQKKIKNLAINITLAHTRAHYEFHDFQMIWGMQLTLSAEIAAINLIQNCRLPNISRHKDTNHHKLLVICKHKLQPKWEDRSIQQHAISKKKVLLRFGNKSPPSNFTQDWQQLGQKVGANNPNLLGLDYHLQTLGQVHSCKPIFKFCKASFWYSIVNRVIKLDWKSIDVNIMN